MKTPVIIAAHNEAAHIGATLDSLDAATTRPIVVVNGSKDATADIARTYGDIEVRELSDRGKLPALQYALEVLGRETALEPFVTLDGDSRPFMKRRWIGAMLTARTTLDMDKPAVVVGPSIYYGDNDPVVATRWTTRHYLHQREHRHDPEKGGFYGRNMLLHLRDVGTLQSILDLPHIWPQEDVAMKDKVLEHGGQTFKTPNFGAAVVTSGRRFNGLFDRFRLGADVSRQSYWGSYFDEMPAGAISYDEYKRANAELSVDEQ